MTCRVDASSSKDGGCCFHGERKWRMTSRLQVSRRQRRHDIDRRAGSDCSDWRMASDPCCRLGSSKCKNLPLVRGLDEGLYVLGVTDMDHNHA